MRAFVNAKAVIIGMGFLMEYIFPCWKNAMGAKVSENILAVTADAHDLEGKQQRMGIRVILNDNAGALQQMRPDWIFFAPPPSVAPGLTRDILLPYYESCRREGRELPILVAFPPSPAGLFYLDVLGQDIEVVNIIPNMISRVGNESVAGEACNLITFPEERGWPQPDKDELFRFFTPMGRCLEVPPHLIMQVLSTEIAVHPLTELADITARCLTERGIPCTYADTASTMRGWHQLEHHYAAPGTNCCDKNAVADSQANALLRRVMLSWYNGLHQYITEKGFTDAGAEAFLNPLFDLYFHEAQLEDRQTIVAKAKKDATKGGMLELCMKRYFSVAEPLLKELFQASSLDAPEQKVLRIGTLMGEITAAVVERGRGMTDDKVPEFSPRQHAILFGLMARSAIDSFGTEAADALLWQAVERYGLERGSRMAQRCRRNGDKTDMVGYFAYGEWRWDAGFRKETIQNTPYFAHYVHQCPWCEGWKESGLAEFGKYYCRNVDESIVRGFDPKLHLAVKSYLSKPGSHCCEFHWKDLSMDAETAARLDAISKRIGTSCVRDFVFHTAHTYKTMLSCFALADSQKAEQIGERVRREFAKLCSYQELLLVLTEANQDFTLAD